MLGVSSVSVIEDQMVLTFSDVQSGSDFVQVVFGQMAESAVNVDMISLIPDQSASYSLALTTSNQYYPQLMQLLGSLRGQFPQVKFGISDGYAKVIAAGEEMKSQPGVAAAVITAVRQSGVDIQMITTSETDISLLVQSVHADTVKSALEG
ncbi:Aspartokinase [Anaerotruncus sp. 2789STDY5834896]|uniref:aspartate kinase n=1 Tax=uncultured Anaerotruncus sp. TaxID=905011 RepID=A0A1C6GPD7_9FIRM|nr:Aspartokinase [uncultured Anaerotruncus sp.]